MQRVFLIVCVTRSGGARIGMKYCIKAAVKKKKKSQMRKKRGEPELHMGFVTFPFTQFQEGKKAASLLLLLLLLLPFFALCVLKLFFTVFVCVSH